MPDPLPPGAPSGPVQPAPASVEPVQPATPQQPAGNPEFEALKSQLESENKRNVSRLQSSLMTQQAETKRAWETEKEEYEQKLATAYMSGMDEKERGEYERDLLRNRVSTMEQKLATAVSERQAVANMQQTGNWFMTMGVKPADLDWTSPETLAQTGTDALQAHVQEMEQKLSTFASQPVPARPATVTSGAPAATPTPVVTSNTGTPSTVSTFEDIRKSLSEQLGRQLTDEDVFQYAGRSPSIRQKLTELATADAERRALARG